MTSGESGMNKIKCLSFKIRFISNLVNVNVITAKSLFEVFEQFLALTTESNLIQVNSNFRIRSEKRESFKSSFK